MPTVELVTIRKPLNRACLRAGLHVHGVYIVVGVYMLHGVYYVYGGYIVVGVYMHGVYMHMVVI